MINILYVIYVAALGLISTSIIIMLPVFLIVATTKIIFGS